MFSSALLLASCLVSLGCSAGHACLGDDVLGDSGLNSAQTFILPRSPPLSAHNVDEVVVRNDGQVWEPLLPSPLPSPPHSVHTHPVDDVVRHNGILGLIAALAAAKRKGEARVGGRPDLRVQGCVSVSVDVGTTKEGGRSSRVWLHSSGPYSRLGSPDCNILPTPRTACGPLVHCAVGGGSYNVPLTVRLVVPSATA